MASATAVFSILLIFSSCLRKIRRKKTILPADSNPPYNYSYSALRRATASFSPSRRLGQGGFGSVFLATFPNRLNLAVKIMDSVSPQSQREFQNELLFASKLDSSTVVSVLGFSSDTKRHRIALVYELMPNGNLQDALLHRKCPELMQWKQRFSIAVDIAKGLEYLHGLNPPVIHGDIKPSNVLLDRNFSAKIADFGLARLKSEEKPEISGGFDGSVAETETVQVVTKSPEFTEVRANFSEVNFNGKKKSRKWWWKQDNEKETEKAKDYVLEWIGSENNCIGSSASSSISKTSKLGKKLKNQKRRPVKEWWRDKHFEVSARKTKKRPHLANGEEYWWQLDEEMYAESKKKRKRKSRSRSSSVGSVDWLWEWDGETTNNSTSSTTSTMRGTVCYIAPEYGCGADISEKCDVYSFGVLLLVLIAGRRPLQVLESPMSEFRRGNLVSWAKSLARNGKLLDLVDQRIECLDRVHAVLCITVALLCLQKSPSCRPSMEEVRGMLTGVADPPQLPAEFLASLPSRFRSKSRKKAW